MEEAKLVHDSRYKVLDLKERKTLFEEYCKQEAVVYQQQAKAKQTDPKVAYQELLQQQVTLKTRFQDFSRKFKHDVRFSRFNSSVERENLFNEHIVHLKKELLDRNKLVFLSLLKDAPFLTRSSKWSQVVLRLEADPRFSVLNNMALKEQIFNKYVKTL